MNNEMTKPVAIPFAWYCAWLGKDDEPVWEQYEECHPASKEWDNFPDKIIPLYTHPVKELTDEEMYRLLADAIWAVGLNTDCLDEQNWADGITVAKAILRKAQEK